MARLNPRLSAGVGVVAAFLLLGGPATTAIAEPGGSHSDRGNSSDRGNDNGNGNGNGNGNDRGDGDRHGNGHGHGRSDGHGNGDGRGGGNDRGYDRGGWNRDDDDRGGWNGDDDDRAVSSDVSRRGADNGNAVAAGGGGGGGSPTARVGSGREDVAQLAPTTASRGSGSTGGSDPTAGSRLTAGAGSIGGSGSTSGAGPESPGAPSAGSSSPRVTVGNGRSPGIQSGGSGTKLAGARLPTGADACSATSTTTPGGCSAVAVVGRALLGPAVFHAATGGRIGVRMV